MVFEIKIIPEIKTISIANEGIIKKANLKIKHGLNIIVGGNASGKTTLIKTIENYFIRNKKNIKIKLLNFNQNVQRDIITVSFNSAKSLTKIIDANFKNSCFLIDNLHFIDERSLMHLSNSKKQIIITALEMPEIKGIDAKIIKISGIKFRGVKK